MKEIKFLRGSSDNFDNTIANNNYFYLTSGLTDTDYKLYIGDKLLAQCGALDELQNQINNLNDIKANKDLIPTSLNQLSSDPEHKTVTEHQINQWGSYVGVVYSENEYVIGKWVDGRNIYRRTIIYEQEFGGIISSGYTEDGTYSAKTNHWAYTEVMADVNVDQYIKIEGTAFCKSDRHPDGVWQPIPRIVPDECYDYSIGCGDFNTTSGEIGVLFRL